MQRAICAAVAREMKRGGYLQRVLDAGPELDRVKAFLLALAGRREPERLPEGQAPWLWPPFPGLSSRPFHEAGGCPAARALEREAESIREEAERVGREAYLAYLTESAGEGGEWLVHPFVYMGVPMPFREACPKTWALLEELPGQSLGYPWSDALLSAHAPGTHLPPHCSVDNLRLRCHLGLRVPEGAAIRVAGETRRWQEGRALLFEDSFEHEAWNGSDAGRVILIVDLWHPELTEAETRALTAGFRKREVRKAFFELRLRGPAAGYRELLRERFAAEDDDPLLREFWG